MNLLITGAAGFIGSSVLRESIFYGNNWGIKSVLGVDWDSGLCEKQMLNFNIEEKNLICSDFSDYKILDRVKNKEFDCVIHLAALPRVAFSVENPAKTDLNNINKSVVLLERCLHSNTPMVFASSSSVYGGAENIPTKEDEKLNPISPYALQKYVFERYLNIYKNIKNYNSISLRFFNVYGPGQDGASSYSTVLAAWLYKIKNGLPLLLEGDGEQRRDFCYVGDVVNCCLLAAQKSRSVTGSFNVATGSNHSCNELLNYLKSKFRKDMINVEFRPPRAGDVKITLANIQKAKDLLGYVPAVDFYKGVDKTIDWWFS